MKAVPFFLLAMLILSSCSRLPPADLAVHPPELLPDEVLIYIRTGCPYCKAALEVMADNGIVPEIRNVTEDRQAYQELLAIFRQHFPSESPILPVIGINAQYLRGFNRKSLEELLAGRAVTDSNDFSSCEDPTSAAEEDDNKTSGFLYPEK